MRDEESINLTLIGQIAVPVKDIDRAIGFYRDTLGMHFLFKAPPGLGFFDCSGVRLLLDSAVEAPTEQRSSIIYYKVEDIHSACSTLKSKGVVLESEPHLVAEMPDHDLWMAFFNDPDNNTLALMCELERSA